MYSRRIKNDKDFIIVILFIVLAALSACGTNNGNALSAEGESSSPSEITPQDSIITDEIESSIQENDIGTLIPGTEYDEGFLLDNILFLSDSTDELHYHIYLPESYDDEKAYALYISLPGYGGYYFQGVGTNLKMESFATEAKKYASDMIIVAPQPNDWGMTSANQIIALTKYLLSAYRINLNRVYISGYSGGGETLSLILEIAPQLYTAALHVSSQWDGEYEPLIQSRTPLYLVIGEADEYYSSEPVTKAYETFRNLYEKEGFSTEETKELLILDIKEQSYFSEQGVSNQHGGGGLIAYDQEIMNWLFSK